MIIDYIALKNYRQYKNLKIDLGIGSNAKNIIVIEGDTGAGKTTLFNAITWCLYGKESLITEKSKGLPLINTKTLHEMAVDEKRTVEVEIQFLTNEQDRRYKVKRTAWMQKLSNDSIEQIQDRYLANQSDGTKLELFAQYKKEGRDVKGDFTYPDRRINQLFPEKINEYFFFDGEKLDDYFKEISGEKIRNAVFKISQLELIDRMIDRINIAKNAYTRTFKGLTPKVRELQEKKEIIQKSLDEMESDKGRLNKDRREAKENRDELNKELRESSIENISKLAEERDRINKDISNLEKELKSLIKDNNIFLIENAPLVYTHLEIVYAGEIISERKEAGDLPPKFRKVFLEGLIKDGECICGADISKDNEHRQHIEDKLNRCDEIDEICTDLIELGGNLRGLKDEIKKIEKQILIQSEGIFKKEEQITLKNKRLKEIEEEIKGCDIDKIRNLEDKLEEFEAEIKKVDEEIGEYKAKIEGAKNQIKIIETGIKKEMEKEQKLSELQKVYSFSEMALEAAKHIKETIMEETRKEVEERTKKQFLKIIWKKENYTDVKISENYTIMVYDQVGRPALATLSAGEREALALSFVSALNEISGFDVPIVIDTPFGRIAQRQRMNMADCLPKLFEKTQVTLLVTDTEYTPDVRKRIEGSIWKEYKIVFHEGKYGNEAEVESYGN